MTVSGIGWLLVSNASQTIPVEVNCDSCAVAGCTQGLRVGAVLGTFPMNSACSCRLIASSFAKFLLTWYMELKSEEG